MFTPRLLAVLLVATCLALGSGAPASASDPMAGAPAVGACYDISAKQVGRPVLSAAPVDCASRHTVRVLDVRRLPARLDWRSPRKAVLRFAGRRCQQELAAAIGGTPRTRWLTLYASVYFIPSKAHREAGARWFSCLVGLIDEEAMVPLPVGDLPRATRRPADPVAWCMTRRFRDVVCTARHSYRASHAFFVRVKGLHRLDEKEIREAGESIATRRCERVFDGLAHAWAWHVYDGRRLAITCFRVDRRSTP